MCPEGGRARVPLLVLLDTSALLLPFEQGLDLDGEVERALGACRVAVPEAALGELRALARDSPDAKAALKLAERYEVVPTEGRGDDAILALAVRERAVVVTADRELMARLAEEGVRVLRPRERHRLELA
jgi:rRNA-processing protein FCF1